jgi:hypothetical protein
LRVQILYLPSHSVGEIHEPRFALIFDQADPTDEAFIADSERLSEFAQTIGAAGAFACESTVEIVQGSDNNDEPVAEVA